MGGVIIAPNIKKTAVRIDINGNEIDPVTKKVIKKKEEPYIPTPAELTGAKKKTQETKESGSDGLNGLIAKKLEEKLGGAIEDALGKMDLGDLISKAIDKALNK